MSVLCPRCGTRWHQAGNRTGHCSRCHRTFSGESTFDAHLHHPTSNTVECVDPATLTDKSGTRRFKTTTDREGAVIWRSAADLPAGTFRAAS